MDQNLEALKNNPRQQKMLDEVLRLVAKAAKDNFPAFLKSIQLDVFTVMREVTFRDGMMNLQTTTQVRNTIDHMMTRIGKDIEARIEQQFEDTRDALCLAKAPAVQQKILDDKDAMIMDQNLEALKNNPQQQKMLDEILRLIAKAAKDNFPAYLKLIQMDVLNGVCAAAVKDGKLDKDMLTFTRQLDLLETQIGKDLERAIEGKFEETKADLCK